MFQEMRMLYTDWTGRIDFRFIEQQATAVICLGELPAGEHTHRIRLQVLTSRVTTMIEQHLEDDGEITRITEKDPGVAGHAAPARRGRIMHITQQ